ncbi:hypothetical protein BDA99DRAFT_515135 [Phascolomyces articulosus]|uniref:Uncharacterized protein n=1 Tax=Phascolomyces articulosus TaxID=60185 RepID=A0AAD5K9X6_9FUNG|nr:hypothetical protein BDA99DRAFT_515135 [Phascolomyces articulosus]
MAPNNRLTQQRVAIIPSKNMAFFDDDDIEDDDTSSIGYSLASSVHTNATANDTFALAEFLSTTSPDEFAKPSTKKKLQQRRASRLLSKLRKRGAVTTTTQRSLTTNDAASLKSHSTHDTVPKTPTSTMTRKHIPLPEYHPPPPEIPVPTTTSARPLTQVSYSSTTSSSSSSASTMTSLPSHHHHQQQHPHYSSHSMRDSGVYSEVSDKDYVAPPPVPPPPVPSLDLFPMPPPSIPAKSRARPRRPAPLPADVASAAINAALRNVPEAALRRRSVVRQRHYQQQMEQEEQAIVEQQRNNTISNKACPHCRQHIGSVDQQGQEKEDRRLSCPPALASGMLLKVQAQQNESSLRQMIAQLEKQLADERTSRKKLEQAMSSRQQHSIVMNKREQVAEERDRWKGESLWMQDRIASLPE